MKTVLILLELGLQGNVKCREIHDKKDSFGKTYNRFALFPGFINFHGNVFGELFSMRTAVLMKGCATFRSLLLKQTAYCSTAVF